MIVKNGATDVTTYFVLRESTNHTPKTDVDPTAVDLYYCEQGAAMASKVDATEGSAAGAHSDNTVFHVGQGLYRIDWPDEAFNGGIGKIVNLIVVCTGVDTTFLEVELTPPVNVGSVSEDATAADNLELAFDGTGYAGGTTRQIVVTESLATQAKADVNAEVDTALADIDLDHLSKTGSAPSPTSGSNLDKLMNKTAGGGGFDQTTDSLEALKDGSATVAQLENAFYGGARTTGAVVDDASNSASTFETNLSASANDHWNGAYLLFTSGTLAGQVRKITDYDGTTKFVSFTDAFTAEPTAADAFMLVNA